MYSYFQIITSLLHHLYDKKIRIMQTLTKRSAPKYDDGTDIYRALGQANLSISRV
jgi:hypothetical protein